MHHPCVAACVCSIVRNLATTHPFVCSQIMDELIDVGANDILVTALDNCRFAEEGEGENSSVLA